MHFDAYTFCKLPITYRSHRTDTTWTRTTRQAQKCVSAWRDQQLKKCISDIFCLRECRWQLNSMWLVDYGARGRAYITYIPPLFMSQKRSLGKENRTWSVYFLESLNFVEYEPRTHLQWDRPWANIWWKEQRKRAPKGKPVVGLLWNFGPWARVKTQRMKLSSVCGPTNVSMSERSANWQTDKNHPPDLSRITKKVINNTETRATRWYELGLAGHVKYRNTVCMYRLLANWWNRLLCYRYGLITLARSMSHVTELRKRAESANGAR